jgi:hypothetical protein
MQHAALQQQRPFTAAVRPARRPQRARAGGSGAAPLAVAQLAEGSRVKVTAPVKIYHVPKYKEGLDLQGMEGTVLQPNVCDYKHHDGKKHDLSATLPVKCQFLVPPPGGGKDLKVLVHLVRQGWPWRAQATCVRGAATAWRCCPCRAAAHCRPCTCSAG